MGEDVHVDINPGDFRAGDCKTRYYLGRVCKDVIGNTMHGDNEMQVFANIYKTSKANVYKCVRVAKAWDKSEFEKLLARRCRDGTSLTWSHFVLLAERVSKATKREHLLERCYRDNLTVKQLQKLVGDRAPQERLHAEAAGRRIVKLLEDARQHVLNAHGIWNEERVDREELKRVRGELNALTDVVQAFVKGAR